MDRLVRHPSLQKSIHLKTFVEAGELSLNHVRRDSSTFETLTDSLLNAFAKVKRPDEKFMEFRETVEKVRA